MFATFPSVLLDFMLADSLDKATKKAVYAALYSNEQLLRQGIDEEGCGPVFAALLFGGRHVSTFS